LFNDTSETAKIIWFLLVLYCAMNVIEVCPQGPVPLSDFFYKIWRRERVQGPHPHTMKHKSSVIFKKYGAIADRK